VASHVYYWLAMATVQHGWLEGLSAINLAESSQCFYAAAVERGKVDNTKCHQTECRRPLLAIP